MKGETIWISGSQGYDIILVPTGIQDFEDSSSIQIQVEDANEALQTWSYLAKSSWTDTQDSPKQYQQRAFQNKES